MAQKQRKLWLDWLVAMLVRFAVCVLQAVPTSLANGAAELLAKLAYRVDKRHRRVAAENLGFAFPEKSAVEIDDLVRRCFRHCGLLLIEIVLLPRKLQIENWRTYADLIRADRILDGLVSDRPLLIVTAHFGNWELAGFTLGRLGFKTFAIARVLDNPYLETFLKRFRQATGQTIIAKKDDFERLSAVMMSGGKVATLGDQDAGPRGVFVEFLGRPASSHKAVALLAMQFDAKMIVIGVPRTAENFQRGLGRYEIICEESIDPRDYLTRPDAVKAITQRYHDALARLIRRHPEQYFWLHRRWKSQPIARKKAD